MVFVKVVKGTPYYKRFQTQFRRRRQGKTDYYARKRLITQDKDKYNTPKYRLVVRITCTKVICQITHSTLKGDKILTAAESSELKRYGLNAGLTNYPSAYSTGLLVARRLLKKIGLDKLYTGVKKIDGTDYSVADEKKDKRPFLAVLDVGLARTTIGNKVFAALKGAADGGLYVPHNNKRFPGFSKTGEEEKYDANVHRDKIFGTTIDKYMALLKKEGEEAYKKQFKHWDETLTKAGVKTVADLYKKIHDSIKANPDRVKREVLKTPKRDHTKFVHKKLSGKQKRANAEKRIAIALKQAQKKGKK